MMPRSDGSRKKKFEMAFQINTNIVALNSLRNLTNVNNAVSASTQKLSSGLRINNAADDPAGLIISESLRAQIDGLNQAVSNSQDAGNVLKTAEGGLTEVNSLLRNVRQLAVHAANTGVNDSVAVQADQAQITSAISSIDRIATQTQFGGKHLLDGSAGVRAAISDPNLLRGLSLGTAFGSGTLSSGDITISLTSAAVRQSLSGGNTLYTALTDTITIASTIIINGQTVSATTADTVQSLLNKINNLTSTTGVTANLNTTTQAIELTNVEYGTRPPLNVTESAATIGIATGTVTAGADAYATLTAVVAGSVTPVSVNFTGGIGAKDNGLHLTDANGNTLDLTEAGNTLPNLTPTIVGASTAGAVQFQIGANAGQIALSNFGSVRAAALGTGTAAVNTTSLSKINVTTATGANDAILVADGSITQVSQLRASLGAFQKNTLDPTIRFLSVEAESLSASESQIRDTDVAAEVVKLTKNQIIQQAATAVLAQANSQPQQILKLLQ